jgi:hypothetical protein
MNMKKILLTLFIAGLGSALSVNAQQGPHCKGGQCQRGGQRPEGQRGHHGEHHGHHGHHERPVWRDVQGKSDIIEVNENNQWVQYQKSGKNCPSMTHRHWQHKHSEHHQGEGHGHGHGQQGHGHGHHGQLTQQQQSGRHVKYQKNQDGSKVDGVMNVREQDGKCWEYTRTSTTSTVSVEDQKFIESMQEKLEVD